MTTHRRPTLALLCSIAGLVLPAVASAQYDVVHIKVEANPSPPGTPSGRYCVATDLNNLGDVLVTVVIDTTPIEAYIVSPGKDGSYWADANGDGFNDLAQRVATFSDLDPKPCITGFLSDTGVATISCGVGLASPADLHRREYTVRGEHVTPLAMGFPGGSVTGVNALGEVSGSLMLSSTINPLKTCIHAVIWAAGHPVPAGPICDPDLDYPGASGAAGINDRGELAFGFWPDDHCPPPGCNYRAHAFFWAGSREAIGGPPGYITSFPGGINNRGEVVGFSETDGSLNTSRPFVWTRAGGRIDLAVPAWAASMGFLQVNAHGQVLGRWFDPAKNHNHGVLYLPAAAYGLKAGMHKLSDLGLEPSDGYFLSFSSPKRLNDQGQILLWDPTTNTQGLLVPSGWTPPPRLTSSAFSLPEGGFTGDPVSTAGGDLFIEPVTDLDLGGPLPVTFRRAYSSAFDRSRAPGVLGPGWRDEYEWALDRTASDPTIVVQPAFGPKVTFTFDGTVWTPKNAPAALQLVETSTGYVYLDPREGLFRSFDTSGRLVAIADRQGDTLTLGRDASGVLTGVDDGLGRALTFAYDGTGKLVSVTDGTRTVAYGFENGDLVSFTDAAGNVTAYAYDPALRGHLVSWTRPDGNTPLVATYAPDGRVARQDFADGESLALSYSTGDTQFTDALGDTTEHFSTSGNLSRAVDAAGNETRATFDAAGRRETATAKDGSVTSFAYAASGRVSSVVYPDQTGVDMTYTKVTVSGLDLYLRAATTWPDGSIDSLERDTDGNVVKATDRNGAVTTYEWTAGRITKVVNPAGGVSTFTWNADGTPASSTAAGATTTFGYDALGRLTTTAYADGAARSASYDLLDRIRTTTDPDGKVTRLEYDGNGNLVSITDATGGTTKLGYDREDRLSSITAPGEDPVKFERDAAGHLARRVGGVDGGQSYVRDALGHVIESDDATGAAWIYGRDARGRVTTLTDPLGTTTKFAWDTRSNLVSTTDALGKTSTFTYDAMGRLTGADDPSGSASWTYDAQGQLTKETLPGGVSASYTYDALGFLTSATSASGDVWRFEDDAYGQMTARVDPKGNRTEYTRSARGAVDHVDLPGGGTVDIARDGELRPIEVKYSDGTRRRLERDAAGRLVATEGLALTYDTGGRVTGSNGIAMTYDAAGRMETVSFTTGKTVTYAYDARGLLASVSDWTGAKTKFTYDANGRLTHVDRANKTTTDYAYDDADRIAGIDDAGAFGKSHVALTRDAAGNVVEAVRKVPLPAGVDAATANALAAAAAKPTRDLMGRTTKDTRYAYTWNLADELVSSDKGKVEYVYDGLGHLIARTEAGRTRRFVWNAGLATPAVSMEIHGGEIATYYVHAPDGTLLYAVDAKTGAHRYYHFDERGSTSFLTGDDGKIVGAWAYSPYGVVLKTLGGSDNPFTFSGRYGAIADGDGLYHMGARVYDAYGARFLSRDPDWGSVRPDRLDPYVYALGNPMRYTDVEGAEPHDTTWDVARAKEAYEKLDKKLGPAPDLAKEALKKVLEARASGASKEVSGLTRNIKSLLKTGNQVKPEMYKLLRETNELSERAEKISDGFEKLNDAKEWFDRGAAAYKYYKESKELGDQLDKTRDGNLSTLDRLTSEVKRLQKNGTISYTTAYAWQKEIEGQFTGDESANEKAYEAGLASKSLGFANEELKSILPSPVKSVVDEVLK